MELKPFDIAEHLDSEEMIAVYLSEVLETCDTNEFISTLGDVVRARGMTELAAKTGLGRESLYKTLSYGSKPRFDTVMKITYALSIKLVPTHI
ncbi:putative addiction module antidote protein [Pasteurella multocida]|uniref:addiction module antidote protein n=1 Tax=Pasteurella multocida TaxID=747 RepID=UPI002B49279E|nr:addiction module antidote protein [Pasteurella multocida]MEB3475752.1 putative addiction module antidote protein [Pasteurella multocida]MEB3506853.1 putative addiction module antidote protein [Pasteurella multocida]WRJ99915.1 putative addiction module antidote protein [Pasteurella multocida]